MGRDVGARAGADRARAQASPTTRSTASRRTPAKYANDFFDLQAGTNGAYTAGPGWDYVSGWGVPDLAKLAADVNGG